MQTWVMPRRTVLHDAAGRVVMKPRRRRGGAWSKIQRQASSGTYDLELLAFIKALDQAKLERGTPFLSNSQIYEVMLAMGYRKNHS